MRISAAFEAGSAGLQRATSALAESAQALAVPLDRLSLGGGREEALVEQVTASLSFRANVKVLQSAQQMSDELLRLITSA
jgi:hypothetical protein